jgi:hypothetical protein
MARFLSTISHYCSPAFRDWGHEVYSFVRPGEARHPHDIEFDLVENDAVAGEVVRQVVEKISPDVVLLGDRSAFDINLGLEDLPCRKAWYAIDSHLHLPWYRHFAAQFDVVFCAQKPHVEAMGAFNPNVVWLPLFYNGTPPPFDPWSLRDIPVSFVGTNDPRLNPARFDLLERLRTHRIPVSVRQGYYAPIYRRSRVVINQAARFDLNFRFFEGPGCGALLVADDIGHSIDEFLVPGEELLTYPVGDAEILADRIRWALDNPRRAEEMARAAWEKIRAAHTAEHRSRTFLDRLLACCAVPRREGIARVGRDHMAYVFRYSAQHHGEAARFGQWCRKRSAESAERCVALYGEEAPWSLLALGMEHNSAGNPASALDCLLRVTRPPEDREFRVLLAFESIWAHHATGNGAAVAACMSEALASFPDDADLLRLKSALLL